MPPYMGSFGSFSGDKNPVFRPEELLMANPGTGVGLV